MTTINTAAALRFFLGGGDAEMARIADVLTLADVAYSDAGLGWGAKASAYGDAIAAAVADGFIPVLIELEVDIELPEGSIVIDHHGPRSGEPASLLQVLALLGIAPTRDDLVVAANDAGWFPGLIALGATPDEMAALHAAFPGGWAGGSGLGDANGSAYWGGYPAHDAVIAFLADRFAKAA